MKVFVHGVPIGHEICGYDTVDEMGYLKNFYNDEKTYSKSFMVIDIIEAVSYYTYMRKYVKDKGTDFIGYQGRPGSYFGITVSFGKETCDNVSMLYDIFDSVYKQIIVGTIIKESMPVSSFMVKEIAKATIHGENFLPYLKAIFQKYITEYIGSAFSSIESSVTTKGEAKFSLYEVDSPAFREQVKSHQVIVSPEFKSSSMLISELDQRLILMETDRTNLKSENETLREEKKHLQSDVDRLTTEHAKAEGDAKKRYQKLEGDLASITKERDSFKETLDKVRKSINNIDERSCKPISHIDSGFPKENHHNGQYNTKDVKRGSCTLWLLVFNSILLLFLCVFSVLNLRSNNNNQNVGGNIQEERVYSADSDSIKKGRSTEIVNGGIEDGAKGQKETVDLSNCRIDIGNYNRGDFEKGKSYELAVKRGNGTSAEVVPVPDDSWSSTSGIIITGSTFRVNESFKVSKNERTSDGMYKVRIFCKVGKENVSRDIKINCKLYE